jgi:hypothetical protein
MTFKLPGPRRPASGRSALLAWPPSCASAADRTRRAGRVCGVRLRHGRSSSHRTQATRSFRPGHPSGSVGSPARFLCGRGRTDRIRRHPGSARVAAGTARLRGVVPRPRRRDRPGGSGVLGPAPGRHAGHLPAHGAPPRAPARHRHHAARQPRPRRTRATSCGINRNRQPSRPRPLQAAWIHTCRHARDRARHQYYGPGTMDHATQRSAHPEALMTADNAGRRTCGS